MEELAKLDQMSPKERLSLMTKNLAKASSLPDDEIARKTAQAKRAAGPRALKRSRDASARLQNTLESKETEMKTAGKSAGEIKKARETILKNHFQRRMLEETDSWECLQDLYAKRIFGKCKPRKQFLKTLEKHKPWPLIVCLEGQNGETAMFQPEDPMTYCPAE